MVDHDFEVFGQCEVDKFFRLRDATGERLFNENMLTVLQCRFGKFVMCPDGRYYGYGEAFYLYEAFRTHLITAGVRFTR